MEKSRWEYIKSLKPSVGTTVHISARAGMIKGVPTIESPGHTFCENRNARKAANRENLLQSNTPH